MIIHRGQSGEEVKKLQSDLKKHGFYTHPKITGFFGPHTEGALKDYQETRGIKPDGIYGPRSQDMLKNEDHAKSLLMSPHIQGTHHQEVLKDMYRKGDHAINLGKGGVFVHPQDVKNHYETLHNKRI